MCSQIGRHIDYNNILTPNQHGSRKGLSCETQLVSTIHELAYSINRKNQTDVIFLDFSKAFNKVSHKKFLHQIWYYEINRKTNAWIRAFLGSRSQQVVVNGQSSRSADVLSGVPQGTVLYSFSQRVITEWNKLSNECINASNVNMFKNKIDTYLIRAG